MRTGILAILPLAGLFAISSHRIFDSFVAVPDPGDEPNVLYYSEQGIQIGSTRGATKKSYVIKTIKTRSDIFTASEILGLGDFFPADVRFISKRMADTVEGLIRMRKFDDTLVVKNVVEILSREILVAMRNKIMDNEKGGNMAINNKEYGGWVTNDDSLVLVTPGCSKLVCDSSKKIRVLIPGSGKAEFHSHPSGCTGPLELYPCPSENDRLNRSCWYAQGPSSIDQQAVDEKKKGRKGYVFGMRSGYVYIYDRTGVIATLHFRFLRDDVQR